MIFCSCVSYSQLKQKDSVWLPIYVKDTTKTSYQESHRSYNKLFYKSIHVPVYNNIETYNSQPFTLSLSELLVQTSLDKSYTISEVQGTELETTLRKVEKFSFPFAGSITSILAEHLELETNKPLIIAHKGSLQMLSTKDSAVLSTQEALNKLHNDSSLKMNHSLYLRHQLLNLIVGNTNTSYKNYNWKIDVNSGEKLLVPYVNSYQNQYMNFDGSYKLITKLVQSYKHLEPYDVRIKNIKKISKKFIGFDVNVLSELPLEFWQTEIAFVQEALNDSIIDIIIKQLPRGVVSPQTEKLVQVLKKRIANLNEIGIAYYNLVSPHKVVIATNTNNIVDVKRSDYGVSIKIFNEIDGKKNPIKEYDFSTDDAENIWLYGLKGNDYFEVHGESKKYIPIKLIGGDDSDKYEIINGQKLTIYDTKKQSFIIHKDKAKLKLSDIGDVTIYDVTKYKHSTNKIQPKFGANPDDGLFVGLVNSYKNFDFNQDPFSELHQISVNFYLGTQGFNVGYYGEKVNVYKGFNLFAGTTYQSPNYSTNFFGFGNDTPNYDDNLKLDYNRIRMEQTDVIIGVLKRHKDYEFSSNLFFESRQIDDTPDRFVSSETLFFPDDDFFDRKNYVGIAGAYSYRKISQSVIENLEVTPEFTFKVTANINEFSKTNYAIQPSLFLTYPFYGDKISLDAKMTYHHVFGKNIPFYQVATIGGSTGLRGYRNQRFTGQSSAVVNTNLRWFIKDLESDILPMEFGVLGGFDAGRVWLKDDESTTIHSDFGAGLWLQTADLIKAELQAFNGNEGMRFSFNLSIGL